MNRYSGYSEELRTGAVKNPVASDRTRLYGVAIIILCSCGVAVGNEAWAAPAPTVEIVPNAIESPDVPLLISAEGAPGQKLYLFILRNCDTDWNSAETRRLGDCNPVVRRRSITLGTDGRWQERTKLSDIDSTLHGQPLWLRVTSDREGRGTYGEAIFSIVADRCSVWSTLIDLFSGHGCTAAITATLTPRMRNLEGRPAVTLEVKKLARARLSKKWVPKSIPNTRNATGVAWTEEDGLLVTIGPRWEDQSVHVDEQIPSLTPGLYHFDLSGKRASRRVDGRDKEVLTAPFSLGPNYLVFVRERTHCAEDGTVSVLTVWRDGRIVRELSLRRTIHQILAANLEQFSILAYSRWKGVPALVNINFQTGSITYLGAAETLFYSIARMPSRIHALVTTHDNAGYNGWDIVVVDEQGILVEELVVDAGEALMPAMRPRRAEELVYLGQPNEEQEVQ